MVRVMPSFISASPEFSKSLAIITDRDRNLTLNEKPSFLKFPRQGHFVNRLEQSWAKILMRMDRAIHDRRADLVLMHLRVSVTP